MSQKCKDKIIIKPQYKAEIWAIIDSRITFELSRMLKEAMPNQLKLHQLTNLMCREITKSNFTSIKQKVLSYYQVHFQRRTDGQFLKTFGILPYPWLHSQFILNFSNAQISETQLAKLASTLRHLITLNFSPPNPIVKSDFLHLTLYKLIYPRTDRKKSGLTLKDFVLVWRSTAHSKWGNKFEFYFESILEEMELNKGASATRTPISRGMLPTEQANDIELSQTDLDWMKDILASIQKQQNPPHYPLSRGPNNPTTRNLEKIVRAICLVQTGPNIQLLQNTARSLCTTYLSIYGQNNEFKCLGE